jgi:predicted MPP superfamily phosphohydrolase
MRVRCLQAERSWLFQITNPFQATIAPFQLLLAFHVALSLLGALLIHRSYAYRGKRGGAEQLAETSDQSDLQSPSIAPFQLLVTLAWLGVEYLALAALAAPLGLSGFGVIHLAYLHLFFNVPLIGLCLAALHFLPRSSVRLSLTSGPLVGVALGLGFLGYYMTYVAPFDLEVTHTTLRISDRVPRGANEPVSTGNAPDPKTLRIGLLADLQATHITDYERGAVAALMAEQPDLILLSGDIIHQPDRSAYIEAIPEFRDLLGTLSAPAGIYFVQGNTDPKGIEPMLFEGTGILGLRDQIVSIPFGEGTVTLGGLALAHHKVTKGKQLMKTLATPSGEGDLRLLLTHLPDPVLFLPENSAIDLVLAGHTHGGQIQLPFFGPPMTLSQVPREIGAGGLHHYRGNAIYVSRGIGVERGQAPRMRLLARPEVSLITVEW